ncbi:helix-turn-helix transcriptional regulator [Streptomyces sp. NPDC001508]|uniref:helix-turn-helix domain-containing protein n=1 Tax=Streptomyces sp. NPDC001508 TaxID=3154656 RepID=UPI00332F3B62
MSSHTPNDARVVPLRPRAGRPDTPAPAPGDPLWRDLVGDVLRGERQAQQRTLKDVADTARISVPYLSEVERGRKEASSEVLAAAARALGLGLGDLLSRAHGELARQTAAARRPSAAPTRGLCLAA